MQELQQQKQRGSHGGLRAYSHQRGSSDGASPPHQAVKRRPHRLSVLIRANRHEDEPRVGALHGAFRVESGYLNAVDDHRAGPFAWARRGDRGLESRRGAIGAIRQLAGVDRASCEALRIQRPGNGRPQRRVSEADGHLRPLLRPGRKRRGCVGWRRLEVWRPRVAALARRLAHPLQVTREAAPAGKCGASRRRLSVRRSALLRRRLGSLREGGSVAGALRRAVLGFEREIDGEHRALACGSACVSQWSNAMPPQFMH